MERGGVELAYEEHGAGPAVMLIHGMADDRRGWAALTRELASGARVIAYDRRGYGDTAAPDVYERTSVTEQAEDAAAVIEATGAAPAVVAGADFGALICLDLLVRHARLVAGAVLLAPAFYALVPGVADDLAAQRVALGEVLHDHGPEAAVVSYLEGAPAERVERARGAHRAFFADYGGLPTFIAGRRELARITQPVVALEGPAGTIEAAAARRLAELIPNASSAPGADLATAIRGQTPLHKGV